jgi:hypothetical protein
MRQEKFLAALSLAKDKIIKNFGDGRVREKQVAIFQTVKHAFKCWRIVDETFNKRGHSI